MVSIPIKDSSLLNPVRSQHVIVRVVAELTVALIGIAFVVCGVLADRAWFNRHFLPTFFAPFEIYIVAARVGRILVAALGAALLFYVRPRFGRLVVRTTARRLAVDGARILAAVVLAL